MQPSFDLRIRTMNKALTEVILPAINATNKAAIEQLQIVVGSLNLIGEQADYAHWYEVADARCLIDMAAQVAREAGKPLGKAVDDAVNASRLASNRHDITLSALREANSQLRAALSDALDTLLATCDPDMARSISRCVIALSKNQIDRERAFVAKTNFDVFPDSLKSIPDALATAQL